MATSRIAAALLGSSSDRICFNVDVRRTRVFHASCRRNRRGIQAATTQGNSTFKDLPPDLPTTLLPADYSLSTDLWRTEPSPETLNWIETIRSMFAAMNDGEISISAYDTAWIARVPDLDDPLKSTPQFPKTLDWIINHQLPDGSWGDANLFLAYDRICSTLSCIVALKTWNMAESSIKRGLDFVQKTMPKLESADDSHMPIGFEIVFPAIIEDAQELGFDVQMSSLQKIIAEREKKLQRIPMDVLHNYPSTLLHSLEGLRKLVDWNQMIKLQSPDGSFLNSPSATACALMNTGNRKCLDYLNYVTKRFSNAAPGVYPVDLFEHLWIVDRVQRLGIAHYFEYEIQQSLEYVHRYWTDSGVGWARGTSVQDIDDTAMAFRLMRMQGYDLSPDVFKNFQKGDMFVCFSGQAGNAVTGMFNLYRASQIMFPNEHILEQTLAYSKGFLETKREKHELRDKWIIMKDLPGEVDFALENPFYASLSRIETRKYIDQYSPDDVWIAKTLYTMPFINNTVLLSLAKADFNFCQSLHLKELSGLQRWYLESDFSMIKFSNEKLLGAFLSAAATIFQPQLATARSVWTRCWFLTALIDEWLDQEASGAEMNVLVTAVMRWDPSICTGKGKVLSMGIFNSVKDDSANGLLHQGHDIASQLIQTWQRWISSRVTIARWKESGYIPSMKEYLETSSSQLEPAVVSTMYFLGNKLSQDILNHKDYQNMLKIMNRATCLARDLHSHKEDSIDVYIKENPGATKVVAAAELERMLNSTMQLLLQETLRETRIPKDCKQLLLDATKITNFFSSTSKQSLLEKIAEQVQSILVNRVV